MSKREFKIDTANNIVECTCYETRDVERPLYSQWTGQIVDHYTVVEGHCCGTQECDPCSCNGNRLNCTHYPKEREEAKKLLEEKKAVEKAKREEKQRKYTPQEDDMKKIDPTNMKDVNDLFTFSSIEGNFTNEKGRGKIFVIDKAKKLSYVMIDENGSVSWYKTGTENEWKKYRGSCK